MDKLLQRRLILLQGHLASGLVQECVGLDENLARQLLGQNGVANLGAPKVEADVGHVVVHLKTGLDIGGGLVDVNLLQILANSCFRNMLIKFFL